MVVFYILVSKLRASKHIDYIVGLLKQYGPVLTFKAGAVRFVWISDGKTVKEMFKREEFSLRPMKTLPVLQMVNDGKSKG